jgi:hypothetical protein
MPKNLRDEARRKLLRPRNPPLPPDEIEKASHPEYYRLYSAKRLQ